MKNNIGKKDKVLRIILGVVIMAIGYEFENWWAILGMLPFISGLLGYCPIYLFFQKSKIRRDFKDYVVYPE